MDFSTESLENKSGRIGDEPWKLPHKLITEITSNFAEEIGRGAFGRVYKGVLENGEVVAVKMLQFMPGIRDQQFQNEFANLKRLKHPNIVRLLGFCDESEEIIIMYKGQLTAVQRIHRALCLEYVPNGSLGKHLSGEYLGKKWPICYKIIKGICEGLKYLREGLEVPIFHFDLKPDNILLDEKMVPKIADFGLSRLIGEENTIKTMTPLGTIGYLPPEFINNQVISKEYDIFSLGVIITQIIAGFTGYSNIVDMGTQEFIEYVYAKWKKSLQEIPNYASLEVECEQVKRCTEVALNCMNKERRKRPTIKEIVDKLDEMENMDNCSPFPLDECHNGSIVLSNSILDRPSQARIAGAVLLAVAKIDSILEDEPAKAIIAKLSEKVKKLKKLPVKITQIRMQLIILSNLIRQIGTAYFKDEVAKAWIGDVRDVAYHVEDVMDKYMYHVLQLEGEGFLKKYFIKGTHYVIVFSAIADEVAEVEQEIQHVIQMKDRWLQLPQHVPDQLTEIERHHSQDRFLEFVKDEDLVGIEENRRLLTEWLYSVELDSTVITVSGMGGLGKSTLVSNVYEREKVSFPVHAWIVVSQIYTVDALLRKLLWKIGHMEPPVPVEIDKMDVHDMKEEIKKKLQNRKCLIVLDDVWEQEVYLKIHDAFQNLQASCIVITTRNDHVGAISSSNRHLELQPLGGPDAFDLFCRRAFYNKKDHTCPKELEVIATSIVDMCQGLPLAIVTIGSMLSLRPQINIWNQTYNQLLSELSNNDHVRAILNLGYHDLSWDIRNCFLYCSLFPEDYPMSRESLVRMWVAEGFVMSKENNTPEEVAEGNLMELIHRNMLEVVDYDQLGSVSTCKLHDIMRDLALSVANEEKFASANDYGAMIKMDKDVRRLSLCRLKDNTAPEVKFPRLRSLVAHGIISSSPDMVLSILSQSSYLTVLELQDSEITEVPAFIGNLFNLRYIGLRRTGVKSLPESIENLFNLHTLDVKQTRIKKLPRGIVKMKKLRHLLADRLADEQQSEFRYFIGVEAPKGLSNFEELQTLETVQASKDLAEQLKKLMQLRSIWIDNVCAADCANLFATLSKMPLLSSLLISAKDVNETLCLQSLEPTSTILYRLIVRGRWAAGTLQCPIFHNHGEHLKYLALSWCQLGEDVLGVLAPHVPNLTYLSLNRVNSASTLVLSTGSFPHLKILVLKRMPDVKQLEIGDGALPCMEGLYIVSLLQLDKVPRGIESLPSLKKLWLLNLHRDFRGLWYTNGMHQKMQHVLEIRV